MPESGGFGRENCKKEATWKTET